MVRKFSCVLFFCWGCMMAYIRPLANGNFRADVCMKGIVKNKTFPSESLAQAWAEKIENSIKTIPLLDQSQLLVLSDSDIETLGGEELFKQLGVDLDESKFAGIYIDKANREKPCFHLPRRECDLIIAGYSAKYRLAIIDRWQELENKNATQLSRSGPIGLNKKSMN